MKIYPIIILLSMSFISCDLFEKDKKKESTAKEESASPTPDPISPTPSPTPTPFTLIASTNTAAEAVFQDGEQMPNKYTTGANPPNPPLKLDNPPTGTQTYVLIFIDTTVTWFHWGIIFPASVTQIPEGIGTTRNPDISGTTIYQLSRYAPPTPPFRRHTYMFRVYALDATLDTTSDLRMTTGANGNETRIRTWIEGKGNILGTTDLNIWEDP